MKLRTVAVGVAWCEGVSLVAALDLDRRLRIDAIDGLALSASATSGAALLRRDGGDAGARHVVATFDGVSGRADLGEEAATLPLHDGISGQAFRANAAGYQEVLAYPSTDAATGVALGEVGWLEDGSVAEESGLLAVLPMRLSPCSCERRVAVATATDGELALAAVVEGASVLYGILRGTALGEMGTLLDLGTSSPPGAAPSPSICWPTREWRLPGEGSPTASSRVLRVSPWDESESPIGRASTSPAHRTIRGPS